MTHGYLGSIWCSVSMWSIRNFFQMLFSYIEIQILYTRIDWDPNIVWSDRFKSRFFISYIVCYGRCLRLIKTCLIYCFSTGCFNGSSTQRFCLFIHINLVLAAQTFHLVEMMIHLFLTYPFVGQKLKTSVKKHNVNPVWNEDLTLSVSEPIQPITIVCICFCLQSYYPST